MTLPEIADRPGSEALQRAFSRAAGAAVIPGNRVDLLIDGGATYAQMFAMIAAASRWIHLENYIIHDDACGHAFAERLIARARAGVTVRVLYDWIGSFSTGRKFWRSMREAGIDVRAFGSISITDPLLIFSRDHRKLLVVDGEHAVTGGLCIGDEWTGNPEKHRLPWRDTAVAVHGPAASALDAAFVSSWTASGGRAPDNAAEVGGRAAATGGKIDVRVGATKPGLERGFRTLDLMLGVSASNSGVVSTSCSRLCSSSCGGCSHITSRMLRYHALTPIRIAARR